jgi:cytochrome b subunit of formate dehydrogenase
VHPANLQATCGQCHQGITAAATQVQIHGQSATSPWVGRMTVIYIVLIVGVIGGMIAFVALDFRKHMQALLQRPQIQRMDRNAVLQHTLLMVSFIVLVMTGFALRYSSVPFFSFAFGWDGGFSARGLIHRIAACVFLFSVIWHTVYLFTGPGRGFLRAMAPGLWDLRQVMHAFSFNLGLRHDHPRYGKFSFVEKAEYWALVWGTVVMAVTGLLLWFRNLFGDAMSHGFLDVMRVIHLYEAWLATLAILIWHFYSVIFKPGVFPGNPSWITGRMPVEMFEEEHAAEADTLRAEGKLPPHPHAHGDSHPAPARGGAPIVAAGMESARMSRGSGEVPVDGVPRGDGPARARDATRSSSESGTGAGAGRDA